jgi:hypothetical protein
VHAELLPLRLLGLGLVEQSLRHPGAMQPCSNCDAAASGAGGTAQDVDTSASCAGHCDIT